MTEYQVPMPPADWIVSQWIVESGFALPRLVSPNRSRDQALCWCPDGGEHSLRRTPVGHLTCRRCGVGLVGPELRVWYPELFATAWGPRSCLGCGISFEPRRRYQRGCDACGYIPMASGHQMSYLGVLSDVLGVKKRSDYLTMAAASAAIDELLRLAEDRPDIGTCEVDGCGLIIKLTRHTRCSKHRKALVAQ